MSSQYHCLLNVFPLQVEVFLLLCLSIKYTLYHGHSEYHFIRFSFKYHIIRISFKVYGECRYFCWVRNQPSWIQAPVSKQSPMAGGFNISHILKAWAGLLSPLLAMTHTGATLSTVQFSKSAIRC